MGSLTGALTTRCRRSGISIIEVITAIAILAVGIWAIVALFPKGQNIIRRSGLRQMATQLAHESISDYLANPEKMPFAIVPYDPTQVPNAPVLLEPAYLLNVRAHFNLVWGEPLLELVPIDNDNNADADEWRSLLRFAPVVDFNRDGQVNDADVRVYREVRYVPVSTDRNGDGAINALDLADFEFFFDPQNSPVDVHLLPRQGGERVLRITYELRNPIGPVTQIHRELYLVDATRSPFQLNRPASRIISIVEEFSLVPNTDNVLAPDEVELLPTGVLRFGADVPRPAGLLANDPRLGSLRADYLIDDPQNANGHWIVEIGTTIPPDTALRQRLNLPANANIGVFQTTLGGLTNDIHAVQLEPGDSWGNSLTLAPLSSLQDGFLVFQTAPNQFLQPYQRVRVAYRNEGDWFVQVIKPADEFQLAPPNGAVLQRFPYERLRWFELDLNNGVIRVAPLYAGLSLQLRWQDANGLDLEGIASVANDGSYSLPANIARLHALQGASLLVRISGRSLWQQEPPERKGDYVELTTVIPPARSLMP